MFFYLYNYWVILRMQLHLRDTFHEVYLLNIGVGFF